MIRSRGLSIIDNDDNIVELGKLRPEPTVPTFALLIWPFVTLIVFRIWPTRRAVIVSLFAGYLFLPSAFSVDLPLLPPFDKGFMISVSLLCALFIFGQDRGHAVHSNNRWSSDKEVGDRTFKFLIIGLVALILLNVVLTLVTNRETLVFGPRVLPGLRPWDMLGVLSQLLEWTVPFFIGRQLFFRPEDHRLLSVSLVNFGLIYAVFILIEIRLSPQFHNWVYGFHQHSFAQHVRDGYFRPKVFLEHGLAIGIFLFMTFFASIALWRSSEKKRAAKWLLAGVLFFVLLVLSRNVGALLIGILSLGFFTVTRRMQLRFITIISVMFLMFPVVRQADMLPIEWALLQAASVSPERAQSLEFRFDNEDILLERASEKPLSGWGGWGRSRVFNARGEDISVTDGLWIIILGTSGWLGYIGFFGLLIAPLLFLLRTNRRKPVTYETSVLAIIITGVLVYLIPNAFLNPIAWLISGALAGFIQFDTAKENHDKSDDIGPKRQRSLAFTRFPSTKQRNGLTSSSVSSIGEQANLKSGIFQG